MKKIAKQTSMALLVLAGITWALWGIWGFNLISYIFGKIWIDRLLYFLMGTAAIYVAIEAKLLKIGLFKRSKEGQ